MLADGGSGGYTGASLVKVGTGTLTLSGVNTYTGATTVDGGTLAVNGSIAVIERRHREQRRHARRHRHRRQHDDRSGGTLAPGNSIGTLYGQRQSGVHRRQLLHGRGLAQPPPTAPMSRAPRRSTGATVQAIAAAPAAFGAKTYTILNASGGFGGTQFAGLNVTGSFRPDAAIRI